MVAKDFFDFVKQDHGALFGKKAVGRAVSPQAFGAADGFTVFVFGGDVKHFAAHVLRKQAGELGFSGAGWAIQEHIDAALPLLQGLAQVGAKHGQVFVQVAVVGPLQVAGLAGAHHVAQPIGGFADGFGQALGQGGAEQLQPVVHAAEHAVGLALQQACA